MVCSPVVSSLTAHHAIAAEILRERHGVTGPVTVHETWGASIVVEIDNLLLKANGDRSTVAEALVAQRVRDAGVPSLRPELAGLAGQLMKDSGPTRPHTMKAASAR
jgi:hypothetical protein